MKHTIVLVHGSWCGRWIWASVIERLRARGHEVHAPTLTGLAERAHLLGSNVTRDTHVQDVVGLIEWEELSDLVLVGHSYGGLVIADAMKRLPADRVRSLVFLDAAMAPFPPPGDFASSYPPFEIDGDAILPFSGETYGYTGALGELLDAKCTPMPKAAQFQPVAPSPEVENFPNKTFVWASASGQALFEAYYRICRTDPRWKTDIVPAGHCLMLDEPELTTEAILRAAA